MRKIPAILLFFMTSSCLYEANCFITATNYVKIDLKKLTDSSTATISINSITVQGTQLVFFKDTLKTAVALPINPEKSETTFIFNYKTLADSKKDKVDTITFSYTNEIKLISESCGAYKYQTNLALVSTSFLKTKPVNSSLLTTLTTSNFEIYF